MCSFTTSSKFYLPQHHKRIHSKGHGKTRSNTPSAPINRTISSSSSMASPPSKTARVEDSLEIKDIEMEPETSTSVDQRFDQNILVDDLNETVYSNMETEASEKTAINPTTEFLHNTAKDLSIMLDGIPLDTLKKDEIGDNNESDLVYSESIKKRFDKLKGYSDSDHVKDDLIADLVDGNALEKTLSELRVNETLKLRQKF